MKPYLPSQKKGLHFVKPKFKDYKRDGRIQLGSVPRRPDGQWDDFLPPNETQRKNVEPMACTSYGTLNAVEMIIRSEFDDHTNWSDRFLAKVSDTQPTGNDPHKVAEALRKLGTVKEHDWPYTDSMNTWEKYFAEIPDEVKTLALALFKAKFDFAHQWVRPNPESMMEALKSSPLAVDVWAWSLRDGIYYRDGMRSTHWVCIYGYEEGKYWKCLDSYPPYLKKLDWNFGFTMVKEYTLHKQVKRENLFKYFIKQIRKILGL